MSESTCTAIILPPREMSFHRVAGVPLIQRTALSALRSGFDAVVAMAPEDGRRVRTLFAADRRTAVIPVVGGALDASVASERVALIPSDCLIDTATLAQVRAADCNGGPLVLASPAGPAIGVPPRAHLTTLDDADATPAAGPTVTLEHGLCLPVADAAAATAAERALVRQLAAATAATDGPIARLDRAVSTRLSRYIVRTPLRPNHITTIGTTIGFLGAWSLSHGTYLSGVIGTLLFWFAVIIDG